MLVQLRMAVPNRSGRIHVVLEPGKTWCGELYNHRDKEIRGMGVPTCKRCLGTYGRTVYLFPAGLELRHGDTVTIRGAC